MIKQDDVACKFVTGRFADCDSSNTNAQRKEDTHSERPLFRSLYDPCRDRGTIAAARSGRCKSSTTSSPIICCTSIFSKYYPPTVRYRTDQSEYPS
jgi:hypothetical protein